MAVPSKALFSMSMCVLKAATFSSQKTQKHNFTDSLSIGFG